VERFPEIADKMVQSILMSVHAWEERFLREHALTCDDCRKMVGVSLV